jgi:uncharacterized protein YbaR (Trm112 family)
MKWYPRSCPVCRGDLHDDLDDSDLLTCFMCCRSYHLALVDGSVRLLPAEYLATATEAEAELSLAVAS